MDGTTSMTAWSDWADAMAVRLTARAQEAEALRSLPAETVREAQEAGFFALLAPASRGGAQMSFAEFLDVVRRMAGGCASSAWTLSFLALHVWLLCKFEPALQEEVFAGGALPMAPAPLAPTGKAEPVEGGYRLTGRWEWATGVNHADWVMLHGLEPTGPRFFVLPISEVVVDDVWKVAGMAATGSNTVVAKDVFVPEHRTLSVLRLRASAAPGEALYPGSTVVYPMQATLAIVAVTTALGALEGALEAFKARMKVKLQAYTAGAKQSEAPATHLRLGEVEATARAARLIWADAIARLEREGPSGHLVSVETLAAIRLASSDVVRLANQGCNTLAAAAGASSGFLTSPIQRHLRDVQMIRGHVMFDWDRTAQMAGRIALGQEPLASDLL